MPAEILLLPTHGAAYVAYDEAFMEYCRYEEGTAPPGLRERVREKHRAWINTFRDPATAGQGGNTDGRSAAPDLRRADRARLPVL